jgi:ketosteroid isomerase-like protein
VGSGFDGARVARQFFDLLHRKDIDAWGELWHPEGTILVFYPADGFPEKIVGREVIVDGFRPLFGEVFATYDADLTAVYPVEASSTVVVEYTNHATLADGTVYTNANIAVFRFEDGLIRWYHDYFDPRRFQVVVDYLNR